MDNINNIIKDEYSIRLCIINGLWCSNNAHKIDYFGNDWIIDKIYILENSHHPKAYGDDIYIKADIYYNKLNNSECYSNGYFYSTSRVIKLSDIIKCQRYLKIKKLKI